VERRRLGGRHQPAFPASPTGAVTRLIPALAR
jgi:hypothetical protein